MKKYCFYNKQNMINFDDYSNKNETEHNLKWPYVPDHAYRILIRGSSGSKKSNALLHLINNQPDIDKIYLYAKDPYEAKYHYIINKRDKEGLRYYEDLRVLLENSNDMQYLYENFEEYNLVRKLKY